MYVRLRSRSLNASLFILLSFPVHNIKHITHHTCPTATDQSKLYPNQKMMNLKICLIFIACTAADASLLRGLAQTTICQKVNTTTYETLSVSQSIAYRAINSLIAVSGGCKTACAGLCKSSPSFVATANSCTCPNEVIVKCSNPFGNPCGPGSACTDTDTGHTCAPTNLYNCPVGCGPNSSCVNEGKNIGFYCLCNSGFYRTKPYLGCVVKP